MTPLLCRYITPASNGIGARKFCDDGDLLAAEGQIDKLIRRRKLQLVDHCLKLDSFTGVEAVQTRGKAIELFYIDQQMLHGFQR